MPPQVSLKKKNAQKFSLIDHTVRRRSRPIISPDEDLAVFMKRKALERKREMKEQQKQKEDAEKKKRE